MCTVENPVDCDREDQQLNEREENLRAIFEQVWIIYLFYYVHMSEVIIYLNW